MRNLDNFQNSLQYIKNQLFVLNYNDSDDLNYIKMKIWVLDGPIRQEEFINGETPDKNVNNPMNHWETLLNDLRYLDKYYRTQEDLLEEREDSFDIYWDKRISEQERFINRTKPDSDETYKDWEQPYSSRPSLLNKDNFEELYQLFITKKSNGELNDVFDIVNKSTSYTIDHESKQAETAVINHIPADEMESELVIKADENKEKNDNNYVKEMKELHNELYPFIDYLLDEFGDEVEEDASEDGIEGEDQILTWKYLVNVPTERVYVNTNNDVGHRGPVIELGDLKQGGYRFVYRDINGNEIEDPEIDISGDLTGELEKGWEDLLIVLEIGSSEELLPGEEPEVEYTTMSISYLPSNPGTELSEGIKSSERFNELNNRWKTINKLREEQISNTGTRTIIESMATADIPELYDDKVNHFNTKKDQKLYYTNILKERKDEFN